MIARDRPASSRRGRDSPPISKGVVHEGKLLVAMCAFASMSCASSSQRAKGSDNAIEKQLAERRNVRGATLTHDVTLRRWTGSSQMNLSTSVRTD